MMKLDESRPMRVLGSICMGLAAVTAVLSWRIALAALSVSLIGRTCTLIVIGVIGGVLVPCFITGIGLIILSPRD